MPDVELVNVTKKYGKQVALDNISLKIKNGEYTVICGPTGAGKTTLLLLLAGLIKPDSGEIYFDGELVNNKLPEDRNVGLMFETFALFPHLNVIRNVTYGPWVRGRNVEHAYESGKEILEMMHLSGWEKALPDELSGGMKQRVSLARALIAESKILLLDEPFGALDAKIKMELRYEMKNLATSLKITAIHATYDIEESMMMADKVVVMNKGKVEQIGTPVEIYENPATLFVANYITEANFLEGILIKKEKNQSLVDLSVGKKIFATSTSIPLNERVAVFIRSEDFDIIPLNKYEEVEGLVGKITDIIFMGGFSRFEVELEDSDILFVIKKLGDVFKNYKEGQGVKLTYPVSRAHLYPLEPGVSIEQMISF